MTAEWALREQVRAALTTTGMSQAAAARALNLSTKHMSQMLTGRAHLPLTHAEDILALCGMRLVVSVTLTPEEPR